MLPSAPQAVHVARGTPRYVPPTGIPAPGFGINEQPQVITSWVNNAHPLSTDTNNPLGTSSQPRKTIPPVLPAGTVVDVQGGPYPVLQQTWTSQGTQAAPVFIVGTGATTFQGGTASAWVRLAGNFFIVEGCRFLGTQVQVAGSAIALRHFEVTGAAGSAVAVGPSVAGTVLYRGTIHHNGDSENPVEHDVHGVLVQQGSQFTWLLESDVHHNGGDAIQVGSAGSIEPWARYTFIGGNLLHQDRENAVDVKRARDVIVSQNVAYGYQPRSSSSGEIVVIHDGAERVWVINNYLTAGVYGVICTQGIDIAVVGNVITNIRNVGAYDPASLFTSAAVHFRNSRNVVASQNTISQCDAGLLIPLLTTGSPSEVVSNIFHAIATPANALRYGNASNEAAATIAANLLPPTDPQFVSATDYHLQSGSPALATGQPSIVRASWPTLYGVPVDRDLYGIPWGAVPNQGAVS